MGANPLSKKKIKVEELSEIEKLLYESYHKIDVNFIFILTLLFYFFLIILFSRII